MTTILHGVVTIIAAYPYFAMATGQGSIVADVALGADRRTSLHDVGGSGHPEKA